MTRYHSAQTNIEAAKENGMESGNILDLNNNQFGVQ